MTKISFDQRLYAYRTRNVFSDQNKIYKVTGIFQFVIGVTKGSEGPPTKH